MLQEVRASASPNFPAGQIQCSPSVLCTLPATQPAHWVLPGFGAVLGKHLRHSPLPLLNPEVHGMHSVCELVRP